MRKVIACEYGTPGLQAHVACPACFLRAFARGAVKRAAQGSIWRDRANRIPIGIYFSGERPLRMICDECCRALE